MEVSPLKYTRAFFNSQGSGEMSDADILSQYIESRASELDPNADLNTVIDELESLSKTKVSEAQAGSALKATRRVMGDQTLGIDDNEVIKQYVDQVGITDDVPVSEVQKMMESSARKALYEQDRMRDLDQVNSFAQLPEAVKSGKELLGIQGQSLFTTDDISKAINIDAVENFLKPQEGRDGIFESWLKESMAFGIPTLSKMGRAAGQFIARIGAEDPERMKDLDRIENTLNDPDAVARYVAEMERYKETPELFTEDEVESLKQATLAFETTSNFFKPEYSNIQNFSTSFVENAVLPVAKILPSMTGYAMNSVGLDREFADSVLREMNFSDQILANQDDESISSIAGGILGSAAQTIYTVGFGVGPLGLAGLYGAMGATGGIEKYRSYMAENGLDSDVGEESFVALGSAVVTGGLAAALTGKTVGNIPILKNFTKKAEASLMQQAIQGGLLANVTRESLFKTGVEAAKKVLSNPALIKESAKAYGKFAAATAPVEAIEEMAEVPLQEILMNLAVEKYETDPDTFWKELAINGIGGAVGGAAVSPTIKSRYSSEVVRDSKNLLGTQHIAASSAEEAAKKLEALERRADLVTAKYGRIPGNMQADYARLRDKLQGVASGTIMPTEAFTAEEIANGSGNILSIGDVLMRGDLAKTPLARAAKGMKGDAKISDNQRKAYQAILEYIDGTDIAIENPEIVDQIRRRIYMTPVTVERTPTEAARTATTTTGLDQDLDGNLTRKLYGVYLTNASDEVSVQDEIFHMINDTRTEADQQLLVNAYNAIYGTNYGAYKERDVRDAIAKKAAAILTGKAKLPTTAKEDNMFVQAVNAQRDGRIRDVNPNFAVFRGPEFGAKPAPKATDVPPVPGAKKTNQPPRSLPINVTGTQILDGLKNGQFRRVSDSEIETDPEHSGKIIFQDNAGSVFTYQAITDSEGNETGVVQFIKVDAPKPTHGPNLVTAIARTQDPNAIYVDPEGNAVKFTYGQPTAPFVNETVTDEQTGRNFNTMREPTEEEMPPTVEVGPQDPNAFYVDPQGTVIEFVDGVPTKAYRMITVTDASGNDIDIIREVDVDLEEMKTFFETGRLVQIPLPRKALPMGNRFARLLKQDWGRRFHNMGPEEYLKAKRDLEKFPKIVQDRLREAIEKKEREDADRAALNEETGVVVYQEPEKTKKKKKSSVVTPKVLDFLNQDMIEGLSNKAKKILEAIITGDTAGIKGIANVGVDDSNGFPLIEVTDQKILDALRSRNLVVTGQVLIDEDLISTLDNIVTLNPDLVNPAVVEKVEAEIEREEKGVNEAAIETLLTYARPAEGPGSKGKDIGYVVLTDEKGDTENFPTKNAAASALLNRLQEEEKEWSKVDGKTVLIVGHRVFEVEQKSNDVEEIILEAFGDDASAVGEAIMNMPEGADRGELIKRIRKFGKQIVNKATGSSLYSEEKYDNARAAVIAKLAEIDGVVNPVIEETLIDEVPVVELETPPPVDLSSSSIKATIRDMRKAVTRGSLKEVDGPTSKFEFRTQKSSSVDIFNKKAESLGAVNLVSEQIEEDGKKIYVVTGNYNPAVAGNIFSKDADLHEKVSNPIVVDPDVKEPTQVHEVPIEIQPEPEVVIPTAKAKPAKKVQVEEGLTREEFTDKVKAREDKILAMDPAKERTPEARKQLQREQSRIRSKRKKAEEKAAKKTAKAAALPRVSAEQFNAFLAQVESDQSIETKTKRGDTKKSSTVDQFVKDGKVIAEMLTFDESGKQEFYIAPDESITEEEFTQSEPESVTTPAEPTRYSEELKVVRDFEFEAFVEGLPEGSRTPTTEQIEDGGKTWTVFSYSLDGQKVAERRESVGGRVRKRYSIAAPLGAGEAAGFTSVSIEVGESVSPKPQVQYTGELKKAPEDEFDKFINPLLDEVEIEGYTDRQKIGNATKIWNVYDYYLNGVKIAQRREPDNGKGSSIYFISSAEESEFEAQEERSESGVYGGVLNVQSSIEESNAQAEELGYHRPVFTKNVTSPIRRFVEDFAKAFNISKPVTVIMLDDTFNLDDFQKILDGLPLDQAERVFTRVEKLLTGEISNRATYMPLNPAVGGSHVVIINAKFIRREISDNRFANAKIMESVSHELGHALMYDVRMTLGKEFEGELRAEYNELAKRVPDMTVAEFVETFFEPGAAALFLNKLGVDIVKDRKAISRMKVSDIPPSVLNDTEKAYFTNYEEWLARNFAKWVSSNGPNRTDQRYKFGTYFKMISAKLRELFDMFKAGGAFEPNETFESWIRKLLVSRDAETGNDNPNALDYAQQKQLETGPVVSMDSEYEREDMLPMSLVDYHMSEEEMEARNINADETHTRDTIYELRNAVPNWKDIEKKVRAKEPLPETASGDEQRYAALFENAMGFVNRRPPYDDAPLDVWVSYSTASSLFPASLSERVEALWGRFRNSFINDARRRLLSPIIVRAQIMADDHPDIPVLQKLVAMTSPTANQDAEEISYTDSILQEITFRTSDMTKALDPIFRHFGYKGNVAKRGFAAATKRTSISQMMNLVFRGVRNKQAVGVDLDLEFDGVRLEKIIDDTRKVLDDLGHYAEANGMLEAEDFIRYVDENKEHYVPRVYDRETILANIEHFRDKIVKRNLTRVYKTKRYLKTKADELGVKLTLEQEEQFKKDAQAMADSDVLNQKDIDNINQIAEQITNNIAYGRSLTLKGVFNPDFQPGRKLDAIIEDFGDSVPPNLMDRKLWFIPDSELMGEVDIDGKQIVFIDTNIISVLSRSIESVVKRVEFAKAYGPRGELFEQAHAALNNKIMETTEDPRMVNKIRRDVDALRGLFESVAEIVDVSRVGTRRFLNEAPIRSVVSSFSKMSTIAVMGLSSFLAIAETGNMFIRTGWKGGMIGLAKFLEVGIKKTLRWPVTLTGNIPHYTDVMERELVALGYLHEVGQDVSSRARFDPFFNEEVVTPTNLAAGNSLLNINNALHFVEDAFYKITMLDQITRISQIAAAHASNVMIRGMMEAHNSEKGLSKAQVRDLKRLGFTTADGDFNVAEFEAYMEFYADLERVRSTGDEARLNEFANANKAMFERVHYRVTSRLVSQQITRPNVATRTVWGNSKNPLIRAAYRLRSFTHGYRALIGTFFTDEARSLYEDNDKAGLAMFIARFLPVLMLALMTVVAREELKADIHEMAGNSQQAATIRTNRANMSPAELILESFDKSGMTMQSSELINAVQGSKYGSGLFSAVYGVGASRAEKIYTDAMRSAYAGDPTYILNSISATIAPGGNTGAFDWMKLDPMMTEKELNSDADFYGFTGW